jgi:peptidoglycan/LPS O-acetylase OafA/YrhL
MKYIPALDGLRAIAVLMVLVTHFWGDPAEYPLLNRLAAAGWAGVDLFFVLSGFLITSILLASKERPHYYRNFYARRTLRIFPLYYLVLAVVLIGLPLVSTLPAQLMTDRWMYFAYLSNVALAIGGWQLFMIDITWSLAIEEQFYLGWPSVVRALTPRRLVIVCAILLVAAPLARLAAFEALGWRWIHMGTPFRLDAFAVGGLLALVQVSTRAAAAMFGLGGVTLLTLVLTGQFARDSFLVGTIGYSLTALTSGAALTLATTSRWLAWRPLRRIGEVSYGMYLLHPLCLVAISVAVGVVKADIMKLTGWPLPDAVLGLLLASAGVYVVAAICYRVYETPFLRLKRYFEPERGGAGPTRSWPDNGVAWPQPATQAEGAVGTGRTSPL